ncbi:hypothetical protein [Xanthobacter autotrophicus]|uniref:Abi-alpha family protein n=1 Tax=Xanthobacter autotrophicus TaxID=280 RepID=UPI0037284A53
MADEQKGADVRLDIGASARAELKAEVKIEIPSASSGRLVDALTDIIRPFSESRGLKADHIRLQREEVAINIAQIARKRIAIENSPINEIPTKFLVPFLEYCSLESDDNNIQEMWAALLANSSEVTDVDSFYALNMLKEISTPEAVTLLEIARNFDIANCMNYDEYQSKFEDRKNEIILSITTLIKSNFENCLTVIKQHFDNESYMIISEINLIDKNNNIISNYNENIIKNARIFDIVLQRSVLQKRYLQANMDEISNGFSASVEEMSLTHLGFSVLKKII